MQTREAKEFASSGPRKRLITVTPETSVEHAIRLMRESKIHHLVVLSEGKCMGIVSAKDLIIEVDGRTSVGDMLRPNVPLFDEATDIKTAVSYMLKNGLTALPLMNDGKVTGIVTETDLLRLLDRLIEGRSRLKDVVNRGEAAMANPLFQSLVKALGDAGI